MEMTEIVETLSETQDEKHSPPLEQNLTRRIRLLEAEDSIKEKNR